ncbi:MAG TPA: hydrogenase formation protein HypD [Chloroflexota bacterium]|nr:hydrogenase formation protein HypD [Chloroflexota bacterium]
MKHVAEYRRRDVAKRLAEEIAKLATEPVKLMEVCGGHTHAIFKFGLPDLLPPSIDLLHGPGCPVCVTPRDKVDRAILLARQPGVVLATYGDMLRVPGSDSSLMREKGRGADVRMVYSPLDALQLAAANPERRVIFFAVGFETTAPSAAMAVLKAEESGLRNFAILSNHVLLPPMLKAILDSRDVHIDGFIGPGHVSTVIGTRPYDFVAQRYGKPFVVSGFEPLDVLQSIWMLLRQLREDRSEVEIQYTRVVKRAGNPTALRAIGRVFEPCHARWRGMGTVPASGLRVRERYAAWDAEALYPDLEVASEVADPKACECEDIVRGAKKPWDCRIIGTVCTPQTPIGACMVSPEGACAAYFTYGRLQIGARRPAPVG